MTRRRFASPGVWSDRQLDADRLIAIQRFVQLRQAEGGAVYRVRYIENIALLSELFERTDDLRALAEGAGLAENAALLDVARYLSGPPISADDLNTIAAERLAGRRRLSTQAAARAAQIIVDALDDTRFPWLFTTPPRNPEEAERSTALRWTAGLKAAQEVQTLRRSESAARQEAAVRTVLESAGFERVPSREIHVTGGLAPGQFSSESLVANTKCDVPVGLRDGRLLLIECKVSNSATNSVKRLNREVGNRAEVWRRAFGERAITACVLAGVYKLRNLQAAQTNGIALYWEHSLDTLERFLQEAV